MSLLPSKGPDTSTTQDGELQVVGVDDDVAPLLDALGSETARDVLNAIYEEPGTPSEIADRLDMSIQKVSYHLDKLEEQDLIAVAGTQYSEKGQEMTVYEPPEDPTVLFVGTEERKRSLKTMVKRLLPVVTMLALGSAVIEQLYGSASFLPTMGSSGDSGAPPGGYSAEDAGGDGGDAGADDGASGGDGADAGGTEDVEIAAEETATTTESGGDVGIAEATETAEPTPTPQATDTPTAEAMDTPTETPVATEAPTPTPESHDTTIDTTAQVTEAAAESAAGLSPGLAFFLGGLVVVTVIAGWWVYAEYA